MKYVIVEPRSYRAVGSCFSEEEADKLALRYLKSGDYGAQLGCMFTEDRDNRADFSRAAKANKWYRMIGRSVDIETISREPVGVD